MYEDYYHLRAKPFRLSPDPLFFFASRGHKRALAYLRYGLSQDEGFVVITGAPGTGKTTLAQILLKEMGESNVVVAHLTTTQLDADEMLRMVAASFGLNYEGLDKPGLLRALEDFLLSQSRQNKRVLLVVDEAQNLPPRSIEELRMLSNLQVGNKALLQTFLLGQTQFHQMLERPDLEQFRQRVIANYHLSELGEDECQRYIESRLQHVGWNGDPHYTALAYEEIYQYTQGIPRRINMLCDRVMLYGFLEETHEIDEALLREVTEELQLEISGKQISSSESSYDHDSLYAEHEQPLEQIELKKSSKTKEKASKAKPIDKKRSDKKTVTADSKLPDREVLKELEAQDKHSAYSINQSDSKDSPLDLDLDVSSMDKVMPEDRYDEMVAQDQEDSIGSEDNNEDANQFGSSKANTQQTNKDRFHVITGGRNERQVYRDEMSDTNEKTANNLSSGASVSVSDGQGDSDVELRKILRLVLAYHRSPRSFPGLDDPSQPLPNGITKILLLAVSDDEVLSNLRQIAVMGISPSMLRAAVRFFIRRVMFIPGGDDYRVLGLSSNSTQEQVEEHFNLLMRIMRGENQKSSEDGSITRIETSYKRLYLGEINHITSEPLSEINYEFDDGDDLDIDLSANRRGSRLSGVDLERDREIEQLSEVITDDQRTAQTSRNIILAVGTIVFVVVLYLTQIMSTDVPDVSTDIEGIAETQQLPEPSQQIVDTLATEVPSDQEAPTSSVSDEVADNEVNNEQDKTAAAEARRQRILDELRAQTEAKEKARREAEVVDRARRDAEAAKAAKAAAEVKARQEAQARARAEAKAQQEAQARAQAEEALVAAKQAQAEAEAKAMAALEVKQENDQARANAEANARISELNVFITRFETAYSTGNLEALLSLFATKARTNDQTDLEGIRGEYKTLFDSTSSRKISLKNMDWELDDNNTRGSGEYIVHVRNNGASSNTILTGNITLQLDRSSTGRLQITRFYFSDAKKVAKNSPTLAPVSELNKTLGNSGALASINELNQMLEYFARAYRVGDINQFMAQFAADAKTSDRSTLQGIRDDYVELFAGTESRNIEFSAIRWQREGGISNGEGQYVVKVKPNGNGNFNVYRGRLHFTIGRYGNKLLISFFDFE